MIVGLEIDGTEKDISSPDPALWDGTIESWGTEVQRAVEEVDNIQFYLGDLLNKGISSFGREEAFLWAIKYSGRDKETLRFYAWVAAKVPPNRRLKELTFNHHRAVARLCPAQQVSALFSAADENWSVNELQARVNTSKVIPAAIRVGNRSLTVTIPVHLYDFLKLYAQSLGKKSTNRPWTVEELAQRAVVSYVLQKKDEEVVARATPVPA